MDALRGILRKYWGFDSFRPLQAEAMQCVVEGRDSVVVMPTGGGKSLCFQASAMQLPGMAVILSPLISLMKDQVDGLTDCGVPAACVNSTLSPQQKRQVTDDIRSGRLKLLYLSPEKLMSERTLEFLQQVKPSFFAIDEAHCISDWGHDFRPEYRMLRALKQKFPGVAIHAYTATATENVRHDIARELHLQDPAMLVGQFDRPNLVYRVQRRTDLQKQIREVVDRHRGDAGIVYCIRRADVDSLAEQLRALGHAALPYHAGMSDVERARNQDAFTNDRAKIIVATVAFGMGIDKSDVRYVIHAAAPKSLEGYQQESGRAGRDGLEAECCLFYSTGDFQTWRTLQRDLPTQAYEIAMTVLAGIEKYATGVTCRHQALVNYFGQSLEQASCGACDVCLGEVDLVADSLVIAQKIISCVVRLQQNFGGDYTSQVLAGSQEQRILENGHDKLSTHGILKEHNKKSIRDWIEQLAGQGFLTKSGEFNLLQLSETSRSVLKGEVSPRLLRPVAKEKKESKASHASWDNVDRGLFEALRTLRRGKADEKGLPPFVIFSDATLRNLARARPSTTANMLRVHGIGEKKLAEYGDDFLQTIVDYCEQHGLSGDADGDSASVAHEEVYESPTAGISGAAEKLKAVELLASGLSIDEVASKVGRARSTTLSYLVEHIENQAICDPTAWMRAELYERIRDAAQRVGRDRLKPIREALGDEVDYDQIRIALACMRNEMPVE